ncbi:hypothetical protein [Mesotoga sp. Brook.08.YT.4.2.5.1]|uniref:hypothetical protein n=1 Tax=Mesotoga sp. Brook.08.YT.4.2.5.1 TaxID=1421001 RepID=UPI002155CCEA|nr:hypothetical protein [Mesotoga sp. Brook.08.YT.4.2.5.1]
MKRLELEEINSKGKPLIIMTAVSICWSILFFNAYSATFLTLSAIVWLYYCITRATIRKLVISRSPDRERLSPVNLSLLNTQSKVALWYLLTVLYFLS